MCQLATCDDRRPRTSLGLTPYTIITHSIKRRQSVELWFRVLSISVPQNIICEGGDERSFSFRVFQTDSLSTLLAPRRSLLAPSITLGVSAPRWNPVLVSTIHQIAVVA
ncbi:hypothetical protein TNCV_94381 [Trichonephila clavipes]|nr:hypothetical protein TNCV_94381 [Trichonephila clavipes]